MDNFVDSGGTDSEIIKATTFLNMIQNTRVQRKVIKMEGNKRRRVMKLTPS